MKKILLYMLLMLFMLSSGIAQNIGASRCGTFIPSTKADGKYELRKDIRTLDTLPGVFETTDAKFFIHYGVGGKNGVSAVDKNLNGIPDYVDSVAYYLELSRRLLVDSLRFSDPPADGVAGGSSAYDVYITDLGNGEEGVTTYGYTVPEYDAMPYKTSWLVIDNDYSGNDKTKDPATGKIYSSYSISGYDALKITIVHEYFHGVQFGYGDIDPYISMLYEMSSSFIEYRAFPEIQYYVIYMNNMLKNLSAYPFSLADASNGYSWSALPIKLYVETGNDSILTEFWNEIKTSGNGFKSLNNSLLKFTGKNLSQQVEETGEWLYFSGKMLQNGKYYPFASKLNGITFEYNDEFSAPSVIRSGELLPLGFYPSRITFSGENAMSDDTLDVIMYNSELPNFDTYSQLKTDFCFSVSTKNSASNCDSLVLHNKFCFNQSLNAAKIKPIIYQHSGIETEEGKCVSRIHIQAMKILLLFRFNLLRILAAK